MLQYKLQVLRTLKINIAEHYAGVRVSTFTFLGVFGYLERRLLPFTFKFVFCFAFKLFQFSALKRVIDLFVSADKDKQDASRKRIWLDSEGEEEDESEQESSEEEEDEKGRKSRGLWLD